MDYSVVSLKAMHDLAFTPYLCVRIVVLYVIMLTIKDGFSPVSIAAFRGHLDVVKFLVIEANADPHQPDMVCTND